MYKRYLAKGLNEGIISIKDHTMMLMDLFEKFISLYPYLLRKELKEIVELAIMYHDIGKVNAYFQDEMYKKKKKGGKESSDSPPVPRSNMCAEEISHGHLSCAFLDVEKVKEVYGTDLTEILCQAIYYHHDRNEYSYDTSFIEFYVENILAEDAKYFDSSWLKYFTSPNTLYLGLSSFDNEIPLEKSRDYIIVKGLLNMLDYAASTGFNSVEKRITNDRGKKLVEVIIEQSGDLSLSQKEILELNDKNILLRNKECISDKSDILLWSGDSKIICVSPNRAITSRVYETIKKYNGFEVEVHNAGSLEEYNYENQSKKSGIEFGEIKKLNSPITICLSKFIFEIIFKYNLYEEQLVKLTYSKVIFYDISRYDTETLGGVISILKMLTELQGRYAIVDRYFPKFILNIMEEKEIDIPVIQELNDDKSTCYNVNFLNCDFVEKIEPILLRRGDKSVIIIINTLFKALKTYDYLKENGYDVELIHRYFTKGDLDTKIEKLASNENKIWIATDIILDMDIKYDILLTSMAPIDVIARRVESKAKECGQIYIFDNEDGYDEDSKLFKIYNFSREVLLTHDNKKITSKDFLKMIDSVYDPNINESLLSTKYYKDIKKQSEIFINRLPYQTDEDFSLIINSLDTVRVISKYIDDYIEKVKKWEDDKNNNNFNDIMNHVIEVPLSFRKYIGESVLGKKVNINKIDLKYDTYKGLCVPYAISKDIEHK